MARYNTYLEHVKAGKGGNRSRNVVGGNEGHDGNHGKTAIVQFTVLLSLQSFLADTREINRGEDNGGQRSSLHVVGTLGFRRKFGNKDSSQNLGLSGVRDGLPGIEGLHAGQGFEGNVLAEHTGEVNSGGLDDVSSGGKHGNSAVLQFGGTEPSKCFIATDFGVTKRVEVLDRSCASRHAIQASPKLGAGSLHQE